MRPVGQVLGRGSRGPNQEEEKTLRGVNFQTGDYLSLAVYDR